tara:strand:+ start:356 stop:571 length:216 start_codon:yes stop_codon:yes gene_type:complete
MSYPAVEVDRHEILTLAQQEIESKVFAVFKYDFLPVLSDINADDLQALKGTKIGDKLIMAFADYMWEELDQ